LAGRNHYAEHERPDYDDDASPPLTHTPGALEKIAEGIDLFDLIEQAMGGSDIDILVNEMSAMAGGAVEGGGVDKKNKKNPTIFREEENKDNIDLFFKEVGYYDNPTYYDIEGCKVRVIFERLDDGVDLSLIEVVESDSCKTSEGHGTTVMQNIIVAADKHDIRLSAFIQSLGEVSVPKLLSWYKSFGFELEEPEESDREIVRFPHNGLKEDKGIAGDLPGHPSGKNSGEKDKRTNEEDPETGKTGNVGPKYKIAREQVDIGEVLNYLLETGVSK